MSETNRKRKNKLNVYLLDEEVSILEEKIKILNITKSEYIRNLILFGATNKQTNFSSEDSEKLIYEINRIGNNVNQIAFRVNTSKKVNKDDFNDLYNNYLELLSIFDEKVSE